MIVTFRRLVCGGCDSGEPLSVNSSRFRFKENFLTEGTTLTSSVFFASFFFTLNIFSNSSLALKNIV